MKKTVFLMLCASLCISFMATSCDKKDVKDDSYTIYDNDWYLQTINSEKINRTELTLNDAYVLKFINDTVFELNTSANNAGGIFYKLSENQIFVKNYHEYTERYNTNEKERNIDEILLNSLNDTFNFSCNENKLVLQKKDITIVCNSRE